MKKKKKKHLSKDLEIFEWQRAGKLLRGYLKVIKRVLPSYNKDIKWLLAGA